MSDSSSSTLLGQAPPTWYRLKGDQVAQALDVNPAQGLDTATVAARRERHGPNELREGRRRGPLAMFLGQFTDFMIVVLIAAAVVAGLVGEPADSIAIVVIVLLNAVIGFAQEYRAERAVAALKKVAAPTARVVREGSATDIPARDLVPGDVVALEAGNVVPADLRLVDVGQLRIDEAALTGESHPVDKIVEALGKAESHGEIPVAERRNMAFKGTVATYGRATGIVVATGMATELGRIAELLGGADELKTPLQRRLAAFGRRLALAVLAICAIVFVAGLARGEPLVLMFLTAVSLAVAAIPEALPAVVTVALALGARRMVAQNALIRQLPAVETLGSVTVICSDKTGTLTRNRMAVASLHAAGTTVDDVHESAAAGRTTDAERTEPWRLLFTAMALNNDTRLDGDEKPLGDPTEVAIFVAARDAGFDAPALGETLPRVGELAFDADRKRMTTLHRADGELLALTKGAPESVIDRCTRQESTAGPVPIEAEAVLAEAERLAAAGQRVLAFAYRRWPAGTRLEAHSEEDLTFIGMVGLIDPPREEAAPAVAMCKTAGIVPVMITGDHPATARAVARQLGIADDRDAVLTGQDLLQLPAAELAARVRDVRVYARVDPEQKIRIVEALQGSNQIVAMTGDGVNDAPALKRADIGVAMGQIGTDVAREAAHMVLLDDNFASIVRAVREGRRIYDNIRKFIRFVMAGNAGEIWTLSLAPFLGMPIPLLPIQILWVNLVTDGLPGLALSLEPAEGRVMQRPPRPPRESVFARGAWQHILWVGLLIGALSLFGQARGLATDAEGWQTMVFTVLTFAQLFHVLAIRSETQSLLTLGLLSNWPLLAAVLVSVAMHLAIVYLPVLQAVFKTHALSADQLALCVALAATVLVAVEVEKWLVRKGWIYAGNNTEERPRLA